MGTSAASLGPSGVAWKRANRAGSRWAGGAASVEEFGEKCLDALRWTLHEDPETYGLRRAMETAGQRLVDVLDELRVDGTNRLVDLDGLTAPEREDSFVRAFVDRIAGDATRSEQLATRRSALACAEELLAAPVVRRALRDGDPQEGSLIPDGLFCQLYRFFFGHVISEFLTTAISAKVLLAAPILVAAPFGAGGVFAGWVADRVMAGVLSPCEIRSETDQSRPLAELGRDLIAEATRQALGLPTDLPDVGQAA